MQLVSVLFYSDCSSSLYFFDWSFVCLPSGLFFSTVVYDFSGPASYQRTSVFRLLQFAVKCPCLHLSEWTDISVKMSLSNVLAVKDREGNLTDCVLTSITNRFLPDNVEGDNNQLINAFDCKKIAQNLSKMEEIVSNNNNNGNVANNAFGSEFITPNHALTKRSAPIQCRVTLNDFELINLDDLKSDPEDCW